MGVFETGGRLVDKGLRKAWDTTKGLDTVGRGMLFGAAAGAAIAAAKRKEDPVTGEKEPLGPALGEGALKGAGIGGAATYALRGMGRWAKKASFGPAFRAELSRLT